MHSIPFHSAYTTRWNTLISSGMLLLRRLPTWRHIGSRIQHGPGTYRYATTTSTYLIPIRGLPRQFYYHAIRSTSNAWTPTLMEVYIHFQIYNRNTNKWNRELEANPKSLCITMLKNNTVKRPLTLNKQYML